MPARGIFKLDGDTLILALAYHGKERPKKFQNGEDQDMLTIVLKRLKP
jgi:hypothetical protein